MKAGIFCSHMSGIHLQVMSAGLKQFCYALSFGCAIITDKQKMMHLYNSSFCYALSFGCAVIKDKQKIMYNDNVQTISIADMWRLMTFQ